MYKLLKYFKNVQLLSIEFFLWFLFPIEKKNAPKKLIETVNTGVLKEESLKNYVNCASKYLEEKNPDKRKSTLYFSLFYSAELIHQIKVLIIKEMD